MRVLWLVIATYVALVASEATSLFICHQLNLIPSSSDFYEGLAYVICIPECQWLSEIYALGSCLASGFLQIQLLPLAAAYFSGSVVLRNSFKPIIPFFLINTVVATVGINHWRPETVSLHIVAKLVTSVCLGALLYYLIEKSNNALVSPSYEVID